MTAPIACPDCGEQNAGRARFCGACGSPLRPEGHHPAVSEDAPPPLSEGGPGEGGKDPAPDPELEPPDSAHRAQDAALAGPKLLWWTIPADSLLHGSSFRALMTMRIATETAINALTYGMLVEVVRRTGSGFNAALVTVCTVAPAALFGVLGGTVVDHTNKRLMLVLTNLVRALLCFGFLLTGQGLGAIYWLLILVTITTQFATPAESAVVPRVVPPDRLAGANSFANLAESAGQALGMAILAPIFVKVTHSPQALIVACGLILAFAAVRAVSIRTTIVPEAVARPAMVATGGRPWLMGTRESLLEAWRYLTANQPAFITVLLLVLASTANLVMVTLAPAFTQQVLDLDPAFAVFAFGPAVLGMLGGLLLVPRIVHRVRPRVLVLAGFLLMVVSLLLIGALDRITVTLRSFDPLGLYSARGPFGVGPLAHADGRLGTLMLLAIPLGFSFSVVQVSANTFLHQRVPLAMQGRVFALQGALKNAMAIVPLLALGGLAALVGVQPVLVVAPLLILFLALYGASKAAQWSGRASSPATAPADSRAAPG